jgi:hypothetical protein
MARDYRMSLYLGPDPGEGKDFFEAIRFYADKDSRFMRSDANFVRHCIRYTLEHDKSLKQREVKTENA